MVRSGWRGPPEDQEFLRSVFVGSCDIFHTVLGPGSDGHHEDHFHLDLMRHASGHHICRPVIKFAPRTGSGPRGAASGPVAPGQCSRSPRRTTPTPSTIPRLSARRGRRARARRGCAAAPSPRPMPAMSRRAPYAVYPSSLLPCAPARRKARRERRSRSASKGDRLDRSGAPTRAASWQAAPGVGSSVAVKDVSRLGPAERYLAQPIAPAYAALPPRPPAPVPNYAAAAPPPRPLAPGAGFLRGGRSARSPGTGAAAGATSHRARTTIRTSEAIGRRALSGDERARSPFVGLREPLSRSVNQHRTVCHQPCPISHVPDDPWNALRRPRNPRSASCHRRGSEARIMELGATLRDLVVPLDGGAMQRVLLGFDALETYDGHSHHAGAIVGRCANRIRHGRFALDGTHLPTAAQRGGPTIPCTAVPTASTGGHGASWSTAAIM